MDLDNLSLDELSTLHNALAVPSGPAAPRELLRKHDVGFHVEVLGRNVDDSIPVPMAAAPARTGGRVVTLSFR